jgi:hypothetical protein
LASGREGATVSATEDLTDWVYDASRGCEDVTRKSNILDCERGSGGRIPDEDTREGKEGLETTAGDADFSRTDNIDDDGGGRRETSAVHKAGVGEISRVNGEDLEGGIGSIESQDVVVQ